MIFHLRVIPGFFITVEARHRPELLRLPVIMGGLPHQRGTVREATGAAQWHGVRTGMTLAQAHQHCPEGVFLVPNLPRYEAVWEDVCAVLRSYTPLVEPLTMGQAVCDFSADGRRWSDWYGAASELSAQIGERTGIVPYWGIAANRLVAELASQQIESDGITLVERGAERAFLTDLPLELLPEIDTRLALTFQVLGLKTIGQFAALPAAAVKARFGALGERLHRYARGIDSRPVVPLEARPMVVARRESPGLYADGDIEEALGLLHDLAEECGAELQRRSLAGTLIRLTLEWHTSSPNGSYADDGAGSAVPALSSPANDARSGSKPGTAAPPIPYGAFFRAHSMLARPGDTATSRIGADVVTTPSSTELEGIHDVGAGSAVSHGSYRGQTPGMQSRTVIVRTPIATAAALFERAQQILLQIWSSYTTTRSALKAIELRVGEFEPPRQLAFAELNRLDQTGTLGGMDAGRREILSQQEQVLAARYGDASFRHLTHIDPDGILTERRFRWTSGLPWATGLRDGAAASTPLRSGFAGPHYGKRRRS